MRLFVDGLAYENAAMEIKWGFYLSDVPMAADTPSPAVTPEVWPLCGYRGPSAIQPAR